MEKNLDPRSEAGSALLNVLILIPLIAGLAAYGISKARDSHRIAYTASTDSYLADRMLNIAQLLIDSNRCHQRLILAGGVVPPQGSGEIQVILKNALGPGTDMQTAPKPVDGLVYSFSYDPKGDIFNPGQFTGAALDTSLRGGRSVRYQMGRILVRVQRSLEMSGTNGVSRLGSANNVGTNSYIQRQIPILMIADDTNNTYRCTTRARNVYSIQPAGSVFLNLL